MAIFITHDYHFTTFRRPLVAKEYIITQLISFKAIAVGLTEKMDHTIQHKATPTS